MHTFTDNEGREWQVRLTLRTEREVHSEAGVYLSDLSDQNTFTRIASDAGLLGDILWGLVKDQAKELDKDSFLDALGGNSLEDALEAVVEETLDFLGRQGERIRQTREESRRLSKEVEEMNLESLKGMTGESVLYLLEKALAGYTALGGKLEDSLELTPEISDLANSLLSQEEDEKKTGSTQAS